MTPGFFTEEVKKTNNSLTQELEGITVQYCLQPEIQKKLQELWENPMVRRLGSAQKNNESDVVQAE